MKKDNNIPSVFPEGSPLRLKRHNSGFWEVTIDNPPLNLFDPELYRGLETLMEMVESDGELKVIVFNSALPDFFIAHFDSSSGAEILSMKPASGLAPWTDISERLFKSEVISIALVRGRTRGVGIEFITACDMCFASLEKAIFGQMEVGVGTIPGGGSMERLPLMLGRARALEVILGANDFDASLAERYGLVNRAIADEALDGFVYDLAMRLSRYDRKVTGKAKAMINERLGGWTSIEHLDESRKMFVQFSSRPERSPITRQVAEWGFQKPGDFELNLGRYLADVPPPLQSGKTEAQ